MVKHKYAKYFGPNANEGITIVYMVVCMYQCACAVVVMVMYTQYLSLLWLCYVVMTTRHNISRKLLKLQARESIQVYGTIFIS